MHSLSRDGIGRDLSEHGRKSTERRALTNWRRHREGLVRIRNETDRATRTHSLEAVSRETCQDTEGNRPSDAHSRTGDGIGTDLSEHVPKETDRVTRTHQLETVSGGTCQNTEGIRPSDAHSRTRDGAERHLSRHGENPIERCATHSLETVS